MLYCKIFGRLFFLDQTVFFWTTV